MQVSDTNYDWHDIGEHNIVLHGGMGLKPACLNLKAIGILACPESMPDPSAIRFAVELVLSSNHSKSPFIFQCNICLYGCLWTFRDEVVEVRKGKRKSAHLQSAVGFDLSIAEHSGSGVIVMGSFTSPFSFSPSDFESSLVCDTVFSKTNESQAHSIRFAFKTPIADPPHLDNFIDDINSLLRFLGSR